MLTIALVGLAGLIFLIVYLSRKNARKKPAPFSDLPKPAHQIAYEALEALKAKNLPVQGKTKQYYSELSDIVRRYIENRFSIKAPEMTTEEFLHSLRDYNVLSTAHTNLLKEFLGLCDIVKFAKYGPAQKEIDDSFYITQRLIDETGRDEGEPKKVLAQ